jgi:hypothetical protein
VREFCLHVVGEGGEKVGAEALDVLVQRVYEDRERQLTLELRRRAPEDKVPAQLSTSCKLAEQTRLADPRLAHDLDCGRRASVELIERLLERLEFAGAPHKGDTLTRKRVLRTCQPRRHPRTPSARLQPFAITPLRRR